MRTQFWRTITPVEGEPIPDGAEFRSIMQGCVDWNPCRIGGRFGRIDYHLEWRVPVETVPLDVAVDLLLAGFDYHWCHNKGRDDTR